MDLDIVLLPPKKLSQKIGALVKGLDARYGLAVAVDNKKLLPHISLLHLTTVPGRIKKIISAVGSIGRKHRRIELIFTKPRPGKKFFVIDVKNAKPLYALHRQVAKAVAKFRTGNTNLRGNNAWDENYFKQYGVANILKNFRPHITLGCAQRREDLKRIVSEVSRLKQLKFTRLRLRPRASCPGNKRGGSDVALAKSDNKLRRIPLLLALGISFAEPPEAPASWPGSFTASRLAVARVNNYHQVVKIFKEFQLK